MYYAFPDYYSGDHHGRYCHHRKNYCENYKNILLFLALTRCRNSNRILPLFWQ